MNLFRLQAAVTPTTGADLGGKTVLITGANQGLGLESARQFLLLGASTVILAVRSPPKGSEARSLLLSSPEIKEANPHANILVMKVDMSDYSSVIEFAEAVVREVPRLDILLLNAGCGMLHFEIAPTGHEKVLQVNYLSNVLLSLKLLPLLESTAAANGVPSRLSIVGSRAQHSNALRHKRPAPGESIFLYMDSKSQYSGLTRYSDSKLLVAMWVHSLSERVSSDRVILNNMCPGMVDTRISDVLPFPLRQIMNVIKAIRARTVEVGGWIIVHAAAVAGKESHGKYLEDKVVVEPTPFMLTEEGKEFEKTLLEETLAEMEKVDPGIAAVIHA